MGLDSYLNKKVSRGYKKSISLKKMRTGISIGTGIGGGDRCPCAGEGTVQGSEGCVCGSKVKICTCGLLGGRPIW